MLDFLQRLLGRESERPSKEQAKERLRLVLVHDRANLSDDLLPALKDELLAVLSKYMEIDENELRVQLAQEDSQVALVANIPIRRIRRAAGFSHQGAGR
ncbi:MAG: cell division topological specificity factor MinE [Limnochordaceae bacterium]|nr:cell division topological specificity factor MinE [Limnochordaceae bacterium]